MNLLIWCMLALLLCSSTKEMFVDQARPSRYLSRWRSYQVEKGQNIQNFKRHSDGTFTNDFTHFADKMKAKDFVKWLSSIKQGGCREEVFQLASEV